MYRAFISLLHDEPFDGQQLGSLPVVSRFIKGIFELRPTTPRSCCTWSVAPVLKHLSSLEPLKRLSLKELTLKLTVLLALTTATRRTNLEHLIVTAFLRKLKAGNSLFLLMLRTLDLIIRLVKFFSQDIPWNHPSVW